MVAQIHHFKEGINNLLALLYYSDLLYYKDLIKTCQKRKMIVIKILKKKEMKKQPKWNNKDKWNKCKEKCSKTKEGNSNYST